MREAELKLIIERLQSDKWSFNEILYACGVSEDKLDEIIKEHEVEVVEKRRVFRS